VSAWYEGGGGAPREVRCARGRALSRAQSAARTRITRRISAAAASTASCVSPTIWTVFLSVPVKSNQFRK
jgi:hypothetical protein